MIYDKLDNLELFKGLSEDVYEGLKFLRQVNADIAVGVYQLTPNVKAIVSEYITKEVNENGYEAHQQYIDIQYLIRGAEKISCMPLEFLNETKAYQDVIDAAFYEETCLPPSNFNLLSGFFAIFFPHDGHMPQLCINEPQKVKKVVVKVRIGE